MLLLLGLTQEGLGRLFFRSRRSRPAPSSTSLGVPDGWEPLGAVAIGWPSPDDQPVDLGHRPRKPISRGGAPGSLGPALTGSGWSGLALGRRPTRPAARLPARLPARMRLARNLAFLTLWSGTALLAAGCGATSSARPRARGPTTSGRSRPALPRWKWCSTSPPPRLDLHRRHWPRRPVGRRLCPDRFRLGDHGPRTAVRPRPVHRAPRPSAVNQRGQAMGDGRAAFGTAGRPRGSPRLTVDRSRPGPRPGSPASGQAA